MGSSISLELAGTSARADWWRARRFDVSRELGTQMMMRGRDEGAAIVHLGG